MTEKQTYWIADIEGVKACVATADIRDYYVRVLGWSDTTEPAGLDRQWVRHGEHGGRGVLNHEAALLHEELGWQPSDPPPAPGVPDSPAVAPAPAPVKSAAKATSGEKNQE